MGFVFASFHSCILAAFLISPLVQNIYCRFNNSCLLNFILLLCLLYNFRSKLMGSACVNLNLHYFLHYGKKTHTMKAIHITKSGGPEVLELQKTPKPIPKKNQVLIKVKAAGINRSDIITRNDVETYGNGPSQTIIPGLEVSGIIEEIGAEVKDKKIGDSVCALLPEGGYAEYVAVDSSHCLRIPNGIRLEDAAGIPETVFTVWFNVFMIGKLQAGEKLLIHGGTSGIGTMGLQMAKAWGCETYSTAGTAEKTEFLKKMGVDHVINYNEQAFEEVWKDEKIDVILDMVGGDYTLKNLSF